MVGASGSAPDRAIMSAVKRAVLVAAKESYRTGDFVDAAVLLRVETIVASDARPPVGSRHLEVDLESPSEAGAAIAAMDPAPDAVVAIDDQGVLVAAEAASRLGLPHNSPEAVRATRDKLIMRELLAGSAVRQPRYRPAAPGEVAEQASEIGFPVVVKPRSLSASRGVIKARSHTEAAAAEERVRAILAAAGRYQGARLLVEEYVPGDEVAVEGLLAGGVLEVLAVIDKPDPLVGPFFEETLYVTPSRHPVATQEAIAGAVQEAAGALGLSHGPVHAELRLPPGDGDPVLLEVAARSIGGLCGRAFTFGLPNESLEVLILRSALGLPSIDTSPARPASGVLMLPIPASGTLTEVAGKDEALAIRGIDAIDITIPIGREVVALPEGDRYLGFVFASGASPDDVERSLREAGNTLTIAIDGEAIRPPVPVAGEGPAAP